MGDSLPGARVWFERGFKGIALKSKARGPPGGCAGELGVTRARVGFEGGFGDLVMGLGEGCRRGVKGAEWVHGHQCRLMTILMTRQRI